MQEQKSTCRFLASNHLIHSDIVYVNSWILHSNGYDIVILGMEC